MNVNTQRREHFGVYAPRRTIATPPWLTRRAQDGVSVTSLSTMKRTTHSAIADDRNEHIEIWINGEFFVRHEAKISVFDSGFLVGDGIWEGIRLHKGKFAFLNRHLDRLYAGAAAIDLDIGLERDELSTALNATVERNSMSDGVHVRLMVTRGDKTTPSQHPSNCVGGPNIVIIAEHKTANPEVRRNGITLFTATVRRPGPEILDQRLNCHSKLHEVIALIQANKAGADEALMLDPTGAVATCNATNFFCVSNGKLLTSSGHYNLNGITRQVVLEVAQVDGIRSGEQPFSLTDVYSSTEAFVTGTFGGLTPVVEVDGRVIGAGSEGPMTRRLRELYESAVEADIRS
jgi:branched-chain amino acid aminotransferase